MHVVLPMLSGITVEVLPAIPLPADVTSWHRRFVAAPCARDETVAGWPFAIAHTADCSFAFFELFDRGIAVVLRGSSAFELARVARTAEVHGDPHGLVALAQLWEAG